MFIEGIIVSSMILPGLIGLKDKPKTPASYSANIKRMDFKESISSLLHNKTFIAILMANGFFFSAFKALTVLIAFIFAPYHFDTG